MPPWDKTALAGLPTDWPNRFFKRSYRAAKAGNEPAPPPVGKATLTAVG